MELSYNRDTQKSDIVVNPELIKMSKISYDQQLLNLCTIIAGGKDFEVKYVSLRTNKDIAKALPSSVWIESYCSQEEDNAIKLGDTYATLIY